jgi:hypothetical protein
MVEQVRAKLSGRQKDQALKLWACAARVFVTSGGSGTVAGHQALVFEDGECSVPGRHFSRVLNTFNWMKNLTIEADEKGLRIGSFTMSVSGYSPRDRSFQVRSAKRAKKSAFTTSIFPRTQEMRPGLGMWANAAGRC